MLEVRCIASNGCFSVGSKYQVLVGEDFYDDTYLVKDDTGFGWYLSLQGDGYYECTDTLGQAINFTAI